MKVDPELMFECLIYINAHYYPVFAVCEIAMLVAKYLSDKKDTPNLDQDAAVCLTRHVAELTKLVGFQVFKYRSRKLVTLAVIILSLVNVCTVYYNMLLQHPILRLEIVLSCLTSLLLATELLFGFWYLMPCYKKIEYF